MTSTTGKSAKSGAWEVQSVVPLGGESPWAVSLPPSPAALACWRGGNRQGKKTLYPRPPGSRFSILGPVPPSPVFQGAGWDHTACPGAALSRAKSPAPMESAPSPHPRPSLCERRWGQQARARCSSAPAAAWPSPPGTRAALMVQPGFALLKAALGRMLESLPRRWSAPGE